LPVRSGEQLVAAAQVGFAGWVSADELMELLVAEYVGHRVSVFPTKRCQDQPLGGDVCRLKPPVCHDSVV
jgi:hypothetical protein